MMVYRAKTRCGGQCDGCVYRNGCPVPDNELKTYVRTGQVCKRRRPEKFGEDDIRNYLV